MAIDVPDVIAKYLAATSTNDADLLVSCFSEDAVVIDDGKTVQGRAEIRAWRDEVSAAFEYTMEPISSTELDIPVADVRSYIIVATIAGNFPGSPVDLSYRFDLRDDLIAALVIAP
ncbi:MAG: hypothetical protein JWN99_1742 [Ilumatobacteraceae bacterium]|jgi:uncharacterized protein (TIGR02246 family)|nr:hypothetical protein [Ilumatobacteraceae bacterium]